LPPNGYGIAAPCTVTRRVHHIHAEVGEVLLGEPLPDSASWMIGTVAAL
jgi:hypothetical protein